MGNESISKPSVKESVKRNKNVNAEHVKKYLEAARLMGKPSSGHYSAVKPPFSGQPDMGGQPGLLLRNV